MSRKARHPSLRFDQFEALKPLDITKGALGRQLRCLQLIGKQAGDNPFIQTIFNPFSVARFLVDERCYIWMRKYPTQFKKGLESITETWVNFIGEVNKTGASGIYLSVSDASYSLMSWDEYKEFGVPGDQALLAANKGWLTVLHHHGDDLMFEYIAKYPVQVMSWYDRRTWPSLAEGKKLFPARCRAASTSGTPCCPAAPQKWKHRSKRPSLSAAARATSSAVGASRRSRRRKSTSARRLG